MDRLFIAVPLPDPIRSAIQTRLEASLPEGLPGRAVPPENWHLTLRFLGDTGGETASRLRDELAAAPLGPPFEIAFAEYGAFPRPRRATVLWVGVGPGREQLQALATVVEECARRAGFPPESRPFAAHLTLSRLRSPEDVTSLLHRIPQLSIPLLVREVVLYRSHLGAGPPRYEAVDRFPLR